MAVTKQQIADRLNIDRTTVSKILNNRQIHNFNKKTVFKVYQTAREMGYDFTAHRSLPQRRSDRQEVNLKCTFTISHLKSGKTYDQGRATLQDISLHGAFLCKLNLPKKSLPLSPFSLDIAIDDGLLKGLVAECEIARIIMEPEFGLGLNFSKISEDNRERIMELI